MSDSPVNIGGIKFGSSETAIESKEEAPRPTHSTIEPSNQEPFRYLYKEVRLGEKGASLYFVAFTNNEAYPYTTLYPLHRHGYPFQSISFGGNGQSTVVTANGHQTYRRNVDPKFDELVTSFVRNGTTLAFLRFFSGGYLVLTGDHQIISRGVPSKAVKEIKRRCAEPTPFLDLAVDKRGAWVLLTRKRAIHDGIPEELARKLEGDYARENTPTAIQHLDGEAWFVTSKRSWKSANIPWQIHKCLKTESKVHALAIAPSGEWVLQYQHKSCPKPSHLENPSE